MIEGIRVAGFGFAFSDKLLDFTALVSLLEGGHRAILSDMMPIDQQGGKGSGFSGIGVVVAGVVGLNILAHFSPPAALALAAIIMLVAATFFLVAIFRKQ